MEAVGFAASVITLVEVANALRKSIKRLQLNAQRRKHLQTQVDNLIEVLKSVGSMSDAAAFFTLSSLQEIKSMLESLAEAGNCPCLLNRVLGCIMAPDVQAKLEEAERKLENLRTEVVVVAGILQLKDQIPTICNARMELPQSHAGLGRAKAILEFLETNKVEELRVVGIYGLPGIGKTTLLNSIWQDLSTKEPFAARAYVQIGHDATTWSLCGLQSSMLQQLGGGRKKFPCISTGKQMMKEYFQQLRSSKKPIFMAIDNVFKVEDLENLLPFKLSKDLLPAFSLIAVTCRNFRVIKALLNICQLQEDNHSQVFCYEPPILNPEECKAVFAECGGMCADEHVELLDALVPLCEGLPLALTVLGKIFVDEKKRKRREWKLIKKQMQVLDGDDEVVTPITKSLRLSYDKLMPTRQAAFLDVVHFFYGWPWETVERIVDVSVLNDLKNSSLISCAEDWTKCNQSALRNGFQLFPAFIEFDEYREPSRKRVVTMHDLTLRFGESLRLLSSKVSMYGYSYNRFLPDCYLEAPKLRNLILYIELPDSIFNQFLGMATNLQMLFLENERKDLLEANATNSDVPHHRQHLHYLRLDGWESSRHIMEMKLSCEIREIHLINCQDVVELPAIPMPHLEWLSIYDCGMFQGFSSLQCDNLKYLEVGLCNRIASVPAELGRLENLRSVEFRRCGGLEDFPSLYNCTGPSHLVIKNCPRLTTLPAMSCPLQILVLGIPIANLVLEETACVLLREVVLDGCRFELLPSELGNASSLQTLTIRHCERLQQLPDELGKSISLTNVDVSWCKHLKGLPSAIGNASSLETLDACGCESLQELPEDLGKLTSLTRLDVSRCRHTEIDFHVPHILKIPKSLLTLSQLQVLKLSNCELPEELGTLTSLRELWVDSCTSLQTLPGSIGDLISLKALELADCYELESLPAVVCKVSSLERLIIRECRSLRRLPEELGKLSCLKEVQLIRGCERLEKLPESICNILSLETLSVEACKSMVELPMGLGSLTSLSNLTVEGCTKLVELPSSICNATSLEKLVLRGCETLKELPEELGRLTRLHTLDVRGCKGLKELPRSLRSSWQGLSILKAK